MTFDRQTEPHKECIDPIRIGIADDHDIVRIGLEKLLRPFSEFHIEGSVQNGLEAIKLVARSDIRVLLLDIAMPKESAFDVIEALLAVRKNLRILILTCYPEHCYAVHLARLGAVGYIDKTAPLEEIVRGIRTIASGGTYFSDRVQQLLNVDQTKDIAQRPDFTLTAREFRVFLRLAQGQRVPEISHALAVSEVTVSLHRSRVLEKLGAKTNSHITQFAIKNGFLD